MIKTYTATETETAHDVRMTEARLSMSKIFDDKTFKKLRRGRGPIRKRRRPKKTWRSTFKEDLEENKIYVSAGMEPAGSPVTAIDGDFSLPDAAPRGTCEPV